MGQRPAEVRTAKLELSHGEPSIWLQDDEAEGTADCGCRLVASEGDSGPALYECDMHRYAADGLEVLRSCLRVAKAWQQDEIDSYHWDDDGPVKGKWMGYDAATAHVEMIEAHLLNVNGGKPLVD